MPPKPDTAKLGADYKRAIEPVHAWAREVTGLPVVYDVDGEMGQAGAVLLHPLGIAMSAVTGPVRNHVSSAEVTARLLVCVIGIPALEAAAATTALALDAVTDSEWLMEVEVPGPEMWIALGRAPAPSFVLCVPVRRLRDVPEAPLVREPLKVTLSVVAAVNDDRDLGYHAASIPHTV